MKMFDSFVHPVLSHWGPLYLLVLGEPQVDFFLGAFNAIAAVADVSEKKTESFDCKVRTKTATI